MSRTDQPATQSASISPEVTGQGSDATSKGGFQVLVARTASRYGTVFALVTLVVVFSILRGEVFLTRGNFVNVAAAAAVGMIISCGLTIPMVANEFDLSIGYLASFAGVLATGLMINSGQSMGFAIVLTLAMSALVGLVNGLLMTRFNVVSFVVTLGTGTVIVGLNYGYSGGSTFSMGLPESFLSISTMEFWGVPLPVYVAVLVVGALWILLNRTVFGYYVRAVGQNPDAARLAGVRVDLVRIFSMVTSSVCAGIGGILLAAELGGGQVSIADGYLLSAFAAAFLGSVCFRDSEFHIIGTVIGVFTVGIAFNGLAILGAPTFWQYTIQGGLLIAAVALSTVGRKFLASR